ncbi:MAG: threonylcarbamoyl-AMP synthase [Gammaproteobacteria bacterium CG11_big_fil_rev_8_21_14_0_20_46_22]|nr:MAG: threonylcarbamoyl-AMP synthase [Gammaproteobacteria bacterium CG12_big_fil_rev_8_21_14_0_65_46_12]PIR10904.1 MAG: threonylcarbamoyl-AMP synthase [Gammaproteobacteria bacterium CG11_big_fil_rev_8_21_14_0_20_46_22]
MAKILYIHPDNPQQRLIEQAVEALKRGEIMIYPTDTSYALACQMGDKQALERLCQIRGLKDKHFFTLACKDLSELGRYAKVETPSFRLLKEYTPGPYTFLLNATKEVPRLLLNPKRKIIGLRVPENTIAMALLETMGEPIITTSLLLPGETQVLSEPYDISLAWDHHADVMIDSGVCGDQHTTVVDLSGDSPTLVRQGKGVFNID